MHLCLPIYLNMFRGYTHVYLYPRLAVRCVTVLVSRHTTRALTWLLASWQRTSAWTRYAMTPCRHMHTLRRSHPTAWIQELGLQSSHKNAQHHPGHASENNLAPLGCTPGKDYGGDSLEKTANANDQARISAEYARISYERLQFECN